jgi:hypothetical protein
MKNKLIDVVAVEVLQGYMLRLQFDDGVEGEVDISQLVPFEGVFAPLRDRGYFASVTVNPDLGTICWENGADLSPCLLYQSIT